MIFAAMLRCPHGSARVKRIDLTAAKALPGVVFSEAYENKRIRFAGDAVAGRSESINRDCRHGGSIRPDRPAVDLPVSYRP